MTFRKAIIVMAIVLVVFCSVWLVTLVWQDTAMSGVIRAYGRSYNDSTQTSVAQTAVNNATIPENTPAPELVPTLIAPTVSEYVLNGTVDLSSGNPVSLTIELPDGKTLQTNWAGTLAYKYTDDIESVFSPYKGVVYSYLGDVTTTWAHSGITSSGQKFFATDLDVYLRKKPGNIDMTVSESSATAESLKGAKALLCQVDSGTVELLSDYTDDSCPGKVVQLEVVAVAVVLREKVDDYKADPVNVNKWLMENYPSAGFDQLDANNGWLISFCVGKLADQTSDGTPSYLYNRGVIGFKIIDGE
jgi:hypothetical protein